LTSNQFFIRKKNLTFPYILLDGKEHHHLSKVARLKAKEKIWLFDEEGRRYLAQIEEIRPKETHLLILEKIEREEPKVKITLGQALVNQKKMEEIIRRSVELGVATFVPLKTARSIIKIEVKAERKLERWQKIAQEALKQSKRSFMPLILPPQSLQNFLKEEASEMKLLLSENRGKYLRDLLLQRAPKSRNKPPSSVVILVGPEGGWAKEEEESILDHGFEAISLGKHTLRTETASLSALALISHFWNL